MSKKRKKNKKKVTKDINIPYFQVAEYIAV